MKFNLFKKKSFNDNKKKNQNKERPKVNSPSQSISSLSSSQSSLQTIHDHHPYQQETRGIFRTLEPVWSFLPSQKQQQWVQLKDHHQRILEDAFNSHESTCTIDLMGNNQPMKIYFNSSPRLLPSPSLSTHATSSTPKKNKNSNDQQHFLNQDPMKSLPMKKKRPVTQLFVPNQQHQQKNKSSPNLLQHQQQQLHYQDNTLYLNYNLRRSLVPYWWFEQDNDQGFKGMCRFDQKNQVRLEALSDDRSTLTLTDIAFPIPFQVVLEPADRSSREEWRGFMYLNHQLSVVHPPSPPLLKHHLHPNQNMFHHSPTIMINDHTMDNLYLDQNDPDDVFYNHDIFLNRRSSI
ncbi:unnamed protein product [Cunninghamella blakesleeana]